MAAVGQFFLKYDLWLLTCVAGHARAERAVRLIRWISRSADGHVYPALLIPMALVQPDQWRVLGIFLFSFSVELAAYKLIKQLVKRPRPFHKLDGLARLIVPQDFFSFPSGHTAGAWVVALSVACCYPGLTTPAYLWAVLVGYSRIYLGVHYPTDVMAGAGLGILSVKAGIAIESLILSASIG